LRLAQTRERPGHHLATIEASLPGLNPDASTMREAFERNLLHRSAAESNRKAGVVNDVSVSDIDAMMRIKPSRADEMGSERGLLAGVQTHIAPGEALVIALIVSSILCTPIHSSRQ
jgi:hypothetical protein